MYYVGDRLITHQMNQLIKGHRHGKSRIPPNWTTEVSCVFKSRGQSYYFFNHFEVVRFGIPNPNT